MDKAQILQAIKALHGEAPANIETEAVCTKTPDLVAAAIDAYGSLGNAVREAGLEFFFEFEFNGVRLRSGRVEVARGLLDWAEMHGPVNGQALKNTAPELLQVVNKLFGNIQRISDRIGLIMAPGTEAAESDSAPAEAAESDSAPAEAAPVEAVPEAEVDEKDSTVVEVVPPAEEPEEGEKELLPLEPAAGESSVDCQICGKSFKRLGLHLSRTHGIGIDEYQRGEF